jgi:hypothetical protein
MREIPIVTAHISELKPIRIISGIVVFQFHKPLCKSCGEPMDITAENEASLFCICNNKRCEQTYNVVAINKISGKV